MEYRINESNKLKLDKEENWKEECGIAGIYAPKQDVSRLMYYCLYALQHRGQESAGISVADQNISTTKGMGLAGEIFDNEKIAALKGHSSIGHVRYSTSGESTVVNAQPLTVTCRLGQLSFAHNGNLVNAASLRRELEEKGTIFQTTSDSEILAHLLARSGVDDLEKALKKVVPTIQGAYTFVILTASKLIAFRDPYGFRPLSVGKLENGYTVASETCAFDTIGAKHLFDVKPGEMVIIDGNGHRRENLIQKKKYSLCIFEYIYFARPDSNLDGRNVHTVRKELGKEISKEIDFSADLVSGVPDSSLSAASGVAESLNLPYELSLIKNRYIGRTFINPSQEMRDIGVKLKLNPVEQTVSGRRIILVDDSIVRGTTIGKLVNMLKKSGAKEINVLITSPPVKHPCFYGIDTSIESELLANKYTQSEMAELIGADSLHFLSIEGMERAVSRVAGSEEISHCKACFDGNYPVLEEGGR